jgi:catechol 2,3-dioxygenase-like lactoylglutathione lyase family enzyme
MFPSMAFPALTHVALSVSDLGRAVAWYSRLFGAPPALEQDEGAFRSAVWLEPLFGLHHFGDRSTPDGATPAADRPERTGAPRPGLDHVAFGCRTREELVTWARRLDEWGVEHGDILDRWYGSGLAFRDPDGNPLELFVTARPSS